MKWRKYNKLMWILALFGISCLLGLVSLQRTYEQTKSEQKKQLEQAIGRGVMTCYALEGAYPPNLGYLEKNYGILVDEQHFIVHYEIFADNIMPVFKVIEKK